jgi:transketolase
MITSEESASLLLQTIRTLVIVPSHDAEADVLLKIRRHIEAERHQMALSISRQATNLLPETHHERAHGG